MVLNPSRNFEYLKKKLYIVQSISYEHKNIKLLSYFNTRNLLDIVDKLRTPSIFTPLSSVNLQH